MDWVANSLNSKNEKVKSKYGNVFADNYGFIEKYKERWDFGKDDTGDISNIMNIKYYGEKYSVDLFTSDCGLPSDESFEQECSLCFLSLSQLVLGLSVLKIGGNLVCKIFIPFTKPLTISIIYLYTQYFNNISIIKQASGSLGSSEVYIVGINKNQEISPNHLDILYNAIQDTNVDKQLFDTIPQEFITELYNLSDEFINEQSKYINRTFYYYDSIDIFNKHKENLFYKAKNIYAQKWILDNNFTNLSSELKL
jgi:hypothetical protein